MKAARLPIRCDQTSRSHHLLHFRERSSLPFYLLARAQGPVAIEISSSANDRSALSHFSARFSLFKAHRVTVRREVSPFLVWISYEKEHIQFSGILKKKTPCANEQISAG